MNSTDPVKAFLGEAGAPEASVTTTITGTPRTVQAAIQKLAKKPAPKKGPASEPKTEKPEAEEIVEIPDGSEGEGGEGGESAPEALALRAESLSPDEIVEELINETADKAPATGAKKKS